MLVYNNITPLLLKEKGLGDEVRSGKGLRRRGWGMRFAPERAWEKGLGDEVRRKRLKEK